MDEDFQLKFTVKTSDKDINDIYNFNSVAFAGDGHFDWSVKTIKKEIQSGWELYSATYENDIIAALFLKSENKILYTKNTPIKMNYQGNGFSHEIKDFYEKEAIKRGDSQIINYCPSENFRMISLNEGHDYVKTGNVSGENGQILEWIKDIK